MFVRLDEGFGIDGGEQERGFRHAVGIPVRVVAILRIRSDAEVCIAFRACVNFGGSGKELVIFQFVGFFAIFYSS